MWCTAMCPAMQMMAWQASTDHIALLHSACMSKPSTVIKSSASDGRTSNPFRLAAWRHSLALACSKNDACYLVRADRGRHTCQT